MKIHIKLLSVLTISLLLTGCFAGKDISKEREVFSTGSAAELYIGIVGQMKFLNDDTKFIKGTDMAVEEINENGGIQGKQVKLLLKDDAALFMNGISAAQAMADNPEITAVIGHPNSYVAIPAASIYDDAGIIMLSPIASNPKVTKKGYKYIFQNIPSDDEIGREMAFYMSGQGYKRAAVFYSDNDYGRGLANAFENTFRDRELTVIDRITGYSSDLELKRILDSWKALEVDSVFIANSFENGKEFISRVRELNYDIPIFGSDALDVNFIEALGNKAEGITLATFFNPYDESSEQKEFTKKFVKKYNEKPDVWAIQGYDSVMLLAYAAGQAGSTSPSKIAAALHSMKGWDSLTGNIHFDDAGKIQGKKIYKKVVRGGSFEYVE